MKYFHDTEETIQKWADAAGYILSTLGFCIVLVWASGILG